MKVKIILSNTSKNNKEVWDYLILDENGNLIGEGREYNSPSRALAVALDDSRDAEDNK